MTEPLTPDAERVLVLAPTQGDASLSRTILSESGLACHVCTDLRDTAREIQAGAGALLLTDDVVGSRDMDSLLETLRSQPSWSDIPILVLSGSGPDSLAAGRALELLGNVTLLEKPVRVATLVSSLRTAIRARRRQYQIRDQLDDLQQAETLLRDTDRRKDEFLATLAHELRNPLAPIRNALHIMRLTADDKAAVEQAREMMERQLGQMVRLIDDLLDVSRITRGKMELRKERVELAAVIRNAVDTSRPLIEASGHTLDVSLPNEPIYLDADPVRLAQVLANLLNNAAKYTERGGRVWLAAERDDDEIRLSVRDTGVGIPAESLGTVFDMFTQVDHSLEKARGGLGIGLTLVKRLVEMHGGNVEAHSAGVGKGSEFVARLPLAAPSVAPHRRAGENAARTNAVRCRILVADDNGDAAESMGTMLRLLGNEVRTVRDGVEAVEEAAAFRPDVVLLDIGMPRLNGYEAARCIRRERWGKDMLLVALTGWGQDEDKRRAAEAGFDRHMTKPVDPRLVEQLVAGLELDRHSVHRRRMGV